jgi:hypothetical protein
MQPTTTAPHDDKKNRVSFSEEKKQKTFLSGSFALGAEHQSCRKRRAKSLLVLFFRKEQLSSSALMQIASPSKRASSSASPAPGRASLAA